MLIRPAELTHTSEKSEFGARIWPKGDGGFQGPIVTYTQNPKTPRISPTIFREGPKFTKLKINKKKIKNLYFLARSEGPETLMAQRGP